MDSFRRIALFYDMRERYKDAKPELNPTELDRYVADKLNDLDPTYHRAPKAVQWWAVNVPYGPFATFAEEMMRTTKNSFTIGWAEYREGKERIRLADGDDGEILLLLL